MSVAPIDLVILALVAVAFVAVVLRIRKKGTCGDCASSGSCSGSWASCGTAKRASCPACAGIDATAEHLAAGVKAPASAAKAPASDCCSHE